MSTHVCVGCQREVESPAWHGHGPYGGKPYEVEGLYCLACWDAGRCPCPPYELPPRLERARQARTAQPELFPGPVQPSLFDAEAGA